MRSVNLGVYIDAVYRVRSDGDEHQIFTTSETLPFLRFACEVGRHFDGFVVLGRTATADAGAEYALPAGVRLAPLPYYSNLRDWKGVLRAVVPTISGMWRGLGQVDVVWAFGPHPLSVLLMLLAYLRGRRIVIGVRQDTMEYFRSRLPSSRWSPVLGPLGIMDRGYRVLARRVPTTVVGTFLEKEYGGARSGLFVMRISLVRAAEVAPAMVERDWSGEVRLLAVGRMEPEKNPLLLVDVLAQLERERPSRYSLTYVGTGRLKEAVRLHAEELGIADSIELPGFIPYGHDLLDFYRNSHVFVHVSLTESFGQVVMEALACGTPVVATDVGGVAATIEGGSAGLLVPPSNRQALVRAICEMTDDPSLRRRCVTRGLELARSFALEAEASRAARFIAGGSG